MGVDAHIAFRATGPIDDLLMEPDWPKIGGIVAREPVPDHNPFGGTPQEPDFNHTHVVQTSARYWDGGEGRNGPLIVTALLYLMRHPHIESVWYGPDGYPEFPLTTSRMIELVHKLISKKSPGTSESQA